MHLQSGKLVLQNYKPHFTDNIAVIIKLDKVYMVRLVANSCCLFNKPTIVFLGSIHLSKKTFMDLKILPFLSNTFSLVRKTIKQSNQYYIQREYFIKSGTRYKRVTWRTTSTGGVEKGFTEQEMPEIKR